MPSIRSRPTVENAATAAEAVRALIHLTLGRGALGEPAELDRLVAELAIMADRLPQLLRQLHGWLITEQHADRLRSDDTTDPARIVDRAAAQLTEAAHAAHDLGRALDNAHQLLAHLAAAEPNRTHEPGPSNATDSTTGTDGQSGPRPATAGQKPWPPLGTFMATSGQVSWPPVGRNRCPLTPQGADARSLDGDMPRCGKFARTARLIVALTGEDAPAVSASVWRPDQPR